MDGGWSRPLAADGIFRETSPHGSAPGPDGGAGRDLLRERAADPASPGRPRAPPRPELHSLRAPGRHRCRPGPGERRAARGGDPSGIGAQREADPDHTSPRGSRLELQPCRRPAGRSQRMEPLGGAAPRPVAVVPGGHGRGHVSDAAPVPGPGPHPRHPGVPLRGERGPPDAVGVHRVRPPARVRRSGHGDSGEDVRAAPSRPGGPLAPRPGHRRRSPPYKERPASKPRSRGGCASRIRTSKKW